METEEAINAAPRESSSVAIDVRQPSRRWLSVLPWSALGATFIVTLRVISVAHLNTEVALQLVQLTDTSKVLFGLAVVVFPDMVITAALYVHFGFTYVLRDIIKAARSRKQVNLPGRALAFALLWPPAIVLAIAFVPTFPGLFILVGVIVLTVVSVIRGTSPARSPNVGAASVREGGLSYRLRFIYITIGLALACVGVAMIAFDDTPWMPAEKLNLTNGRTVVGYVAAQSSSELVILLNSSRSIVTVPVDLVRSSSLCQVGKPLGGNQLIAQLFWHDNSTVPLC